LPLAFCVAAVAALPVRAEEAAVADAGPEAEDAYETVVPGASPLRPDLPSHRAGSEVTREDMESRLPRSAPDALRYEPGVFVQQTAHGQGSVFLRGLTGQQTLLLFDGIRLNNGTWRQGPNQYFFTVDPRTVEAVEVQRGGASTRFGSDALGGVLLARPIEARLASPGEEDPVTWDPHLILRGASADRELGGRTQTNLTLGRDLAFFGGVGGRRVGQLESGGPVFGPEDGQPPRVPRFDDDGRTQLGTGFDEFTADGRVVWRADRDHRLTLAGYTYRQFDAPRTDQCPAAYAPHDECLVYDNQFRNLVYLAWDGEPGRPVLHGLRATLSWQDQRERRTLGRPSGFVENTGRDVVDTFGVTLAARTARARPAPWLWLRLDYGADTYHDLVRSAAWVTFTDVGITERRSRGQYLDGSRYTSGGLFVEETTSFLDRLFLRGGARLSWIAASAQADPASGSAAVSREWFPVVGNIGVEGHVARWWHLLFHFDRSYRAPNIDDLTSRQQTGPGFQFENPDLGPEIAHTVEVGTRLLGPVSLEVFAFRTLLHGAVVKRPVEVAECPPDTPACTSSWNRFQLHNATGASEIRGLEGSLGAQIPGGLEARAGLAWTWGEGPNPADPPADPALPHRERVPLSRVPPLQGMAELAWHHGSGFRAGGAVRFAALQDRLALADVADERIPAGGTPGFAVLDLRAGYRLRDLLNVSLAFENVFDAAYRYHGSSVNGPGRGVALVLDLGPLWRL
jgi:iron complex outermembrane receptor protein/hemoglobin/transferrin/lactoferrin receptor protein